jgi:hypothetical protein
MIRGMATDKVTISLQRETLARAKEAAEAAGVSLSAWIDQAARRQALRDRAHLYYGWLDANPDVKTEIEEWREITSAATVKRWDELGESA